jgi:uncharacterized membrane protein
VEYLIVKWVHIVSSTMLFGTGLGSAFYMFFASRTRAFYMFFASRTRDARAISVVVRYVVIADWLFTTPTIILQPATGLWLVHLAGFDLRAPWLLWSIVLYLLAGACWLPVVWMQVRMRDMAAEAARQSAELPAQYWSFLRWWVALGIVAFFALVVVFYLMVLKPS